MLALARRRSIRVACAFLALLALCSCKHTQQIRALTFGEIYAADGNPAQHGERVVTTGVVIYSDSLWRLLLLQDSSQTIYLPPPANLELRAGDQVQINGTITDAGKFLDNIQFRVTDSGQMPTPRELNSAAEFEHDVTVFTRVPATVRWSGIRNGRATIEAASGGARVTALVYPGTSEDLPRIGSEIEIAGVPGPWEDHPAHAHEWRLLTPSARYIRVVRPGPTEPFSVPLVSLSSLTEKQAGRLVHVSGKVMDRASSLLLIDGSQRVELGLRRPLHGDFASAEVVGFWTGTAIDDAVIRPTGELLAHRGDIRTVSELKHLSVAEASAGRSVSIRGVVTYFDSNWGLLFVQDQTGAVFIATGGLALRLKTGDLVDVSGVSAPGDYAPVIADPEISVVGHGSLPKPLPVDPVQSNLAIADSRWSTLHGVVHSVQEVDGHTNLKLGAGEAAVNVQLPTLINGERLVDKEIAVVGALGILFNEKRQARGHQIFVPGPEFVAVVGTGGTPNPDSTIAMLSRYSPEFDEHHSVGFHGQVVLKSAANTIFVQDETAGIQVRTVADANVVVGDRVDVRGFLRGAEYSPAVEDAVVTRNGHASLLAAQHVSANGPDFARYDSQYVAMEGVLAAIREVPNSVTLVLNENGTYFDVLAPSSPELRSIRLGSRIEARGIFRVTLDRTHVPFAVNGFNLVLDSPDAVVVRKMGPWWDTSKVGWALMLFAVVGSAGVLWANQLRRQVRKKTHELQLSLSAQVKALEFDHARNGILESIARNAPLPESMERLALAVEEQIPGIVCGILMPPDGKSFLNGKPAPVFIAPGLSESAQHSRAFLSVLKAGVSCEGTHISVVESDVMQELIEVLRAEGGSFTGAHSAPVFSSAGAVVGVLALFSKAELPVLSDPLHQNVLQSASRLISLAHDHWQMHERLVHEARHDGLTGLPNRAVAEDRLEQALARAERRKKSFAVFCIDLDGFKGVNDKFGHDAGDELLRAVAVRLRARIRHSDTLARMGGDEFLAIIDECSSDAAARSVANSLIAALNDPIDADGQKLPLSASIGISMYPADGRNAAQLRRNADQAMYRAKSCGGGQACFLSRSPDAAAATAQKGNA